MLTDAEIASRLAERESAPTHRWVRPLSALADSLIDALQVEDGVGLGLSQVDVLTRGFRPTDLVVLTGFAHSGKTQLVNTMICNNRAKRILFFSLDDPGEMILAKLVSMHLGRSAESIETRLRAGDPDIKALLRQVAGEEFPNLILVDEVIGIPAMQDAVAEATDVWGRAPDAVVIDYVEMMPGNGHAEDLGATVKMKLNALKGWAKQAAYPVIALHQGTRSNAKPGDPITLLSMGFSGEQQATIVIGCRRKRDKDDLEAWERQHHEHTITVHVVKNKRPGGKMTHFDGLDFHLDPATGLITTERDPSTLTMAEAVNAVVKQAEMDL